MKMGASCRVLSRLCCAVTEAATNYKERRVDIKLLGIERRSFGSNGVNDLRVISLTKNGIYDDLGATPRNMVQQKETVRLCLRVYTFVEFC